MKVRVESLELQGEVKEVVKKPTKTKQSTTNKQQPAPLTPIL